MALTQAGLDQEINTQLPSGSGIPAAALRQVLHDMNASVFQSVPATAPPSINSILNATSATVSVWTATPSLGSNGGTGGSLTLNGATSGNVSLAPSVSNSALNVNQAAFGPMFVFNGPNATIANQISTVAAISGNAPAIKAIGTDTSVSLNLQAQGTGGIVLLTPGSVASLSVISGVQLGAPTGGDKGIGTLNSGGSIYINNAPIEAGQRVSGTVGVTGTTSFSITVPANATITGVTVYTTTAFTASGTVTLQGGTAVGDNVYFAATSIKALGVYTMTLTSAGLASMPATSPNFFLTLIQTGTPTNVGACTIVINYLVT